MKQIILLKISLLLALCPQLTLGQVAGRMGLGGALSGMGNTGLTQADGWSLFNNIGALAQTQDWTGMVGVENRYTQAGLFSLGAGFVGETPFGGMAGISALRFGDNLYNEQAIGLGYSHKISGVSLGVKVNYLQLAMEGLGSRQAIALEFGGVAQLTKKLKLGMHIFNLNQAKMADFEDERIPTIMRAGVSYSPSKRVHVNIETEKDADYPAIGRAGIAYDLVDAITIRTGLETDPFIGTFGITFRSKKLHIDYALQTHPQLGLSNMLSMSFLFKERAQKSKAQQLPAAH